MNDRFERASRLGILPGLVNVAGKLPAASRSVGEQQYPRTREAIRAENSSLSMNNLSTKAKG